MTLMHIHLHSLSPQVAYWRERTVTVLKNVLGKIKYSNVNLTTETESSLFRKKPSIRPRSAGNSWWFCASSLTENKKWNHACNGIPISSRWKNSNSSHCSDTTLLHRLFDNGRERRHIQKTMQQMCFGNNVSTGSQFGKPNAYVETASNIVRDFLVSLMRRVEYVMHFDYQSVQ